MKHRHKVHEKHRAKGGAVEGGGNPNVIKEAEERKKGGRAKRKHGGKSVEMHMGHKAHHRLDRPGRKRGGRIGADKSPLSSAHNATAPEKDTD